MCFNDHWSANLIFCRRPNMDRLLTHTQTDRRTHTQSYTVHTHNTLVHTHSPHTHTLSQLGKHSNCLYESTRFTCPAWKIMTTVHMLHICTYFRIPPLPGCLFWSPPLTLSTPKNFTLGFSPSWSHHLKNDITNCAHLSN